MKKIRFSIVNLIISILFSLASVFGFSAKRYGEIKFASAWTYIGLLGIGIVSYFLVALIWELFDRILKTNKAERKLVNGTETNKVTVNSRYVWLKSTITIWLLNFVVFLGVYPGFFCYDAQDELMETITRSFNNQHPMLHVLSMGGIVQLFHKLTGDYNIGIAAFILFQMMIIAVVLGFLIKVLSSEGLGRKCQIILSIYFGAFPVLVMYSLCSSKDGVFGAFLVLSVLKLRQLLKNPDEFFKDKKVKNITQLILSLVFMMLMRSNGAHAFIVFAILFIAYVLRHSDYRKYVKNILFIVISSVVLFFLINTTLLRVTDSKDVGHREILTVPIQQIARLYSFDRNSLEDEEINNITEYVSEDALNRYAPKCSDMVKIGFLEDNYLNNTKGFYDIWLSLGLKHPAAYINAFVMTSYGMYYPWAVIDGYKDHEMFTYTYGDSSYFGYEVEPPGERCSVIPFVDDFYRWLSLDASAQRIPVLHLLLSPGFMLWIYIIILGYVLKEKRIEFGLPYVLPFVVILTCLIGPMSLVRYSFYLWIFIPMVFADLFLYVTKRES